MPTRSYRPKHQRSLSLPWERRSSRLRTWLPGIGRWRWLLAAASLGLCCWTVFEHVQRQRQWRQTRLAMAALETASTRFYRDQGRFPQVQSDLIRPSGGDKPYLENTAKDAWGRSLRLLCPAPTTPYRCQAISAGPSGSFLNDDNIN